MILYRHLMRHFFKNFFLVLIVVLSLQFVATFLYELGQLKNNYDVWHVILYVLMQLPALIYQLLPIIGLMAAIVVVGRMSSNSELVVYRSSGLSLFRISAVVMLTALGLYLLLAIVGETLVPRLYQYAKTERSYWRNGERLAAVQLKSLWFIDNEGHMIYVKRLTDKRIEGVTGFMPTQNQQGIANLWHADSAEHISGMNWSLHNFQLTKFDPNRIVLKALKKQKPWLADVRIKLLKSSSYPETMSLMQLQAAIAYRQAHGMYPRAELLVWYQRLLRPLAFMVMILLGMMFVFSNARRGGMTLRVILGALVGFLFYVINMVCGFLSFVLPVSPFWVVLAPIVLFAVLGVFILRMLR